MATAARFSTVTSCWCIRNKVSAMFRQCAIVIVSLCLLADLPQVTAFTMHRLQDSSSPSSGGLLASDKAGNNDNSLTFKSSFRQDIINLIDSLLATLETSETKEQQLQEKKAEQQRWWKKMSQGQMPAQGQGHYQSSFVQQQLPPLVNSNTAVKAKKASLAAAATPAFCIWKICPPYSYRKTKRAIVQQRR